MEPVNWFMNVVTQHYFDFNGRARRAEFWWFILVYVIGAILVSAVGGLIGLRQPLSLLYSLGLLAPHLGVTIRRLHDTNRTGWLVLIAWVPGIVWEILVAGAVMMGSFVGVAMISGLFGLIFLAGVIVLIYFLAQPGTAGSNDYGPDPKAGLA